jgi:predicted metal-dependent enzyme (double-stranded beta helix superfamily)
MSIDLSRIDHVARARTLAAAPETWRHLVDFDPVTRYYARIEADTAHEAWLLTWLPGQGTFWHDHGASAGSFVILQGSLREEVAQVHARGTATPVRDRDLEAGVQRTFTAGYVHRVTNTGLDPAVSLHVYAPRLTTMTTWAEEYGQLVRSGLERAGVDW